MNKNTAQIIKPYEAIVGVGNEQSTARIKVSAKNRREAVHKCELWFWYEYKGKLGPVHKAMVVLDPYGEVHYDDSNFFCTDRMNKLLPHNVIDRLILESNGKLTRDTREGRPHSPQNSVRRVKRRRDFGVFVAPGIRRMKNAVLYYRVATVPQRSRNGRRLRKRKYHDIRLVARTLAEALVEIKARGLEVQHEHACLRRMKVRSLLFTAHVAGLITLNPYQRGKFSKVLPKYEEPRAKRLTPAY